MIPTLRTLPARAGLLSLLLSAGCSDAAHGADAATANEHATPALSGTTLAPYQDELLTIAFEAASAMPLAPHVKNRSRAQEAVIAACLELDQADRALGWTERIANWRRGSALADVAFHQVTRDATAPVSAHLETAAKIADDPSAISQDWHRDRIRGKIARVHAWLGDAASAARFAGGLVDSESGWVDEARAMRLAPELFDARMDALERTRAAGTFEQLHAALRTYAVLFERFYEDAERRARVEDAIRATWTKLPARVRIETTADLAGTALARDDAPTARALLDEARTLVDAGQWTPEDRIALVARLAGLRHRAGDRPRARSDADAALATFHAERERIVDIDRADAVRPLAEAYAAMDDAAAARAVYAIAVDEGARNPNSRPRAEDLAATCCSMAVHAVEPDAALRQRIRQILAELGEPW